jgi:hypothetical protein
MGYNIVLLMFCLLAAFLMASLLKARYNNGRTWGRSILIALESPTCFITVSKMYILYSWYAPKKQWGELPDLWSKISMMLWILCDWAKMFPRIHSLTIGAMVEVTLHKEYHNVSDVLQKNGLFVLSED